ncbi:MAG: UDP-N-acetylmuramoyl-tripeptide--D-alanyl-D-alanine ligase [Pseudomonadota bacterium]
MPPIPLWTATEAMLATGGTISRGWHAHGVSIDTRTLAPGDLFVALQGEARDGHDFVVEALAKGAAAALVAHVPAGVDEDAPLLLVDDTLRGLRGLARAARARTHAKVIAITGSAGKTTTKDMARAILAHAGPVHAAELSLNNHWGVPLTLARMPADTAFAVLEIGMNHAGEITPLSRLARPHVAVVTTVAEAHLGQFDDITGIAHAKAEIFAGLEPGGTAVLPLDNAHLSILAAAAEGFRALGFGTAEDATLHLVEAAVHAEATVVQAHLNGAAWSFRIGAPGRHLADCALAALSAAAAVGVDPARGALALSDWQPVEGRGGRWDIALGPGGLDGTLRLIDDSYNANPASVRAAFGVLAAQPVEDGIGRVQRGRRIAFLGDMLELGQTEMALHAGLAKDAAAAGIDVIHCCGPRMRALYEALPGGRRGQWCANSEGLAAKARSLLDAGDVCVVKGSKGARMGRVVDAVKALGTAERAGRQTAELTRESATLGEADAVDAVVTVDTGDTMDGAATKGTTAVPPGGGSGGTRADGGRSRPGDG